MNPHTEILSPVGSFASLTAAMQAGADAIYFGVGNLNMRSRSAANFTLDDIHEVCDICHHNGAKAYLTVNTIIYDHELPDLHSLLDAARTAGVDAIIASDIAVITVARRRGLTVHISTQCNISNIEAVRFYAQYADAVVLARELSLKQVSEITQAITNEHICGPSGQPLRVEIFVHGALCMSISGKCYLSLDTYNSSANRGACLQLCRRGYTVKDIESNTELLIDNEYIMSPKDLCTIGFLNKILDAGVSLLKIEGRGRSADYVRTTTECYREAVAAINNGTYDDEHIAAWTSRLSTVFNRGFWDGYYLGRKLGEWSNRYGSFATEKKVFLGLVKNYFSRISVAEITLQTNETLRSDDEIMVIGDTTGVYRSTVGEMRTDRSAVDTVSQGDIFSLKTSLPVRRGDKVYRIDKTEESTY